STTCTSTPVATYPAASATEPQRWTWSCPSVSPSGVFQVNFSDQFTTTPIPATASATFNAIARPVSVTTRYQPLMPYWFYDNEWYKLATYGLSPSRAPSAGFVDCGAATSLTVGGTTVSTAVAVLAGSRLPAQTRPSSLITNYLEGGNATAATNCTFVAVGTPPNSGYNDQLIILQP
ncbi:MAG: hypothetical protein ABL931_22605, partial [Usitatibacteraceae bacterium]